MQRDHAFRRIYRPNAGSIVAIRIQTTGEGLAPFADFFNQCALENPQPIAIGPNFVLASTMATESSRSRIVESAGFNNQVIDAGSILLAYASSAVELNIDMQPIIFEQYRRGGSAVPLIADKLVRVCQAGDAAIFERDDKPASCTR